MALCAFLKILTTLGNKTQQVLIFTQRAWNIVRKLLALIGQERLQITIHGIQAHQAWNKIGLGWVVIRAALSIQTGKAMKSLEEYLERTESAAIKLFDGIDSYIKILRDSPKPIFTFSGNIADLEADSKIREQAYDVWKSKNEEVKLSLGAQRDFLAESFALATLCGSILQIAAMGIQWFSVNKEIPEDLPEELKSCLREPNSKLTKFCVGRRIHTVPSGLVIYAGRNQYNHMNDKKLTPLNTTIFNLLAHSDEDTTEQFSKDPAFDLENSVLDNRSSNITTILEWENYESYYADMHSLIVAA